MGCLLVLPTCLLLLWTLTALVSCNTGLPAVSLSQLSEGVKLSCGENYNVTSESGNMGKTLTLQYKDENTGEYWCGSEDAKGIILFVKFRTCDNCIEFEEGSLAGMAVGNLVATIVMGVGVYLIASNAQPNNKKRSDTKPLIPADTSSRAPNDHYQPLRPMAGQRDTYDVLTSKR